MNKVNRSRLLSVLSLAILAGLLTSFFWTLADTSPPLEEWSRTFGGSETDWGYSVQETSDGGYIIVGETKSFGAGEFDVYLVKTDSQGQTEWSRTFGGLEDDVGYSVQETRDGGYIITGDTLPIDKSDCDGYLVKTDSQGREEWSTTFGGSGDDSGYSVQQTSDGGYIITGETNSFDVGGYDVYLVKTDAQGREEWSTTFGGIHVDIGYSVQETSDGGYIITGETKSFGAGGYDVYLVKTDSQGVEEWSRTFGGSEDDVGFSGQVTSDGGYIIAGDSLSIGASLCDVYLVKTDSQGIEEWSRTFGGSGEDSAESVQVTSDGGYIIAGITNSSGAGGYDVYLVKTDAQGIEEWSTTFGGSEDDGGTSVQMTSDGGYIIAGTTDSSGAGGYDAYLVKVAREPSPEPEPARASESPLGADITLSVYPNGDFEMRAHGTLEQSYDYYQDVLPIQEMLFSVQGEPVDTDLYSGSGSIVFKLGPQFAIFLASLDLDIDLHAERLSSETTIQLDFPGMMDLEMSVETSSQDETFRSSVDVEATATIWYSMIPEETISMFVLGFPLFKGEIESQLLEYSDGNLELRELTIIESELGETSATITAKMTVEGDFVAGMTAFAENYASDYMDPIVQPSIPLEAWTIGIMRSGDVHISFDSEDLSFTIEYEVLVEGDVDEQFNSLKDLVLEELLEQSDLDPEATRIINSLLLPSEVSIVNLGIAFNATHDAESYTMDFNIDRFVLKPPSPEALLSFLEEASEEIIEDKLTLTLEGASQGKEYVEIQVPDETTEALSEEPQKVVWIFADLENLDKVTFEVKEKPSAHAHQGLDANPGEVAVTTVIATAGSIGAGLATGGANSLLNVGRVDEGLRKRKKVKRSRLGQARTLLLSVFLIGGAYSLVTIGTFSLGYILQLPWNLPVIGSTLPVSYVSGASIDLFLQVLPTIFLSTGIVFLWRYILETITAKVLGIKIALEGNKIGAASLIGTTILAHPYGFPMTTVFEGHVTVKDRGALSFMRNFGLLTIVAPLLYVQREGLLGDSSFLLASTGILIVLMTFFYTAIPYKGEGIDLFKWNKGLDLLLIVGGLALYLGYKTSMISTDILMWASIGATVVVLVFLLNLIRGRKQLVEDRRLEDFHGNSTGERVYDESGSIDESKPMYVGSKDEGELVAETKTPYCSRCGKPATWIEEYKRWYCYDCREYLPE